MEVGGSACLHHVALRFFCHAPIGWRGPFYRCPRACLCASSRALWLPIPSQAQIVAALRSYGRLPTARPAGGVSSGRLLASPAPRSGSARSGRAKGGSDTEEEEEEGAPLERAPRPRRQRKLSSKSLGDSPAPSRLGAASPIDWQAALAAREGDLGSTAAVPGLPPPPSVAAAQQAQLQALSAALLGGARPPSALSGAAEAKEEPAGEAAGGGAPGFAKPPGLPLAPAPGAAAAAPAALLLGSMAGLPLVPGGLAGFGGVSPLGAFEAALSKVMARSHELERPEGEGPTRPLHSGPKGQSGFKGVTLYK